MKAIFEIKSYDDFRKMSFSDFFYALRANGGEETEASAKGIIAAIDPGFIPKILKRRKEVILLQAIRKAVADRREEHLRAIRMEEEERKRLGAISKMSGFSPGHSYSWERIRLLQELQAKLDANPDNPMKLFELEPAEIVKIKLKHLSFAELLNLMKDDLLDESFIHVDALTEDEDCCSSFLASLDVKIQQLTATDANRVLKGLYMLPLLEDDQDLIIFFGTAFHTTFENVDAYTGLLYSSTYFDTEESYLIEVFSSTSEAETASVIRKARNNRDYSRALKLFHGKAYDKAALAFEALGDFKYSRTMMKKALRARDIALKEENYARALKLLEEEKYNEARALFEELGDYRDSSEMEKKIPQICEEKKKTRLYEDAKGALQESRFVDAEKLFLQLGKWRDAPEMANLARENNKKQQYEKASAMMCERQYEEAERIFTIIDGYKDAGQLKNRAHELAALEQRYGEAERLMLSGKYRSAEAAFNDLGCYLDASERAKQASILWSATQTLAAGYVETARKILNNPVISHLKATAQIEVDLQVLEESIKRELDRSAKLEKLMKERDSVNERHANLRERAATPVPSQKEWDASVHSTAQIKQALQQLGMFDFKARRDLRQQLQKEIARQDACCQRVPIEIEERKKEIEEVEEALAERKAAIEEQITLQGRLIEDARLRSSRIKRKYNYPE